MNVFSCSGNRSRHARPSVVRPGAVFLLTADRTVQYTWVAQEWPDFPDYDEVEDELAAL